MRKALAAQSGFGHDPFQHRKKIASGAVLTTRGTYGMKGGEGKDAVGINQLDGYKCHAAPIQLK